jgi:hypothetical protein
MTRGSLAARRAVAGVLAFAGFAILALRAIDATAPLSISLSLARKFWRAGTPTRLLNTRPFQHDVAFGAALLSCDRLWPLSTDALLVLPTALPDEEAEAKKRKAAWVLAPRRVAVERGPVGPDGFSLRAEMRGP